MNRPAASGYYTPALVGVTTHCPNRTPATHLIAITTELIMTNRNFFISSISQTTTLALVEPKHWNSAITEIYRKYFCHKPLFQFSFNEESSLCLFFFFTF